MNNKADNLIVLKSSKNEVEAIRQCVQTICIFQFQNVTGRELDLLCEILRCGGVNEKAKKSFKINYKTTNENYGQLVKRLADKEILIEKEMRNGKELAPLFFKYLELYVNNKSPNLLAIKWHTL